MLKGERFVLTIYHLDKILLSTINDRLSACAFHNLLIEIERAGRKCAPLPAAKVDLVCSWSLLKPTGLGKYERIQQRFSSFCSGAHSAAYIYLSISARRSEVADCQEAV